jgi:S-methylmethionine-dependent homocysteine/selenocysteine methylase
MESQSITILDGGVGRELRDRFEAGEANAWDVHLFSTGSLLESPDHVTQLHSDYIAAGANVITTASYAVTRSYLSKINE